jgi:hypothetical protein
MSVFGNINLKLVSLSSGNNLGSLLTSTFDVQSKLNTAVTSKLGTQINQVLGGFQSITQEADVPADFVSNSGVAMLVENPPGLNIAKQAGSSNSDLEAITESTMGGGFLNIAVTANTPEAIAKSLSAITNQPATAMGPALKEILPSAESFTSQIDGVLSQITKGNTVFSDITQEISTFEQKLSQQLSGGLSALFGNLSADFQTSLPQLFSNVIEVNANTPVDSFSRDTQTINSSTHIQSILGGASREITTVVVGCSNTFKDQDVRASNVPGWHFLITLAGELQEVTNINTVGDYAINYNTNTIGVVFAGGLNTTLKEAAGQDKSRFVSAASITRAQYNAFDKFMQMFYFVFPYGQVVGLQDIPNTNSSFPGFDVQAHCRQRFNKITVIDTGSPAPTLKELELRMSLNAQGVSNPGIEDEPNETDTGR